jgi:hypothetical protein
VTTPVKPARSDKTPAGGHAPAAGAATAGAARTNPLLPPAVAVEGFFPDLSVQQKAPTVTPAGFEPLYTAEDWQAYREKFGAEADGITRLKSSGILEVANRWITAAAAPERTGPELAPGVKRLLLLRAAAVCYRNRDGFPTADRAVATYLAMMDKRSAAQVGGLWTVANAMSRMAVTPKPERIRYDGIAAKANMQLALLLVEADQVEAAQGVIKLIGYHEGWLKSDPATRGQIGQVRARVNSVAKMMEYLGAQYGPALRNDEQALMAIYLYGRYVKNNPAVVADLPGRVPNSRLAQLAASIDAAGRDAAAAFPAAENLRVVATTLPDGMLRQRTLYAALQHYRAFLNDPGTERDRIHRTLARMSLEAVIADGAHAGAAIDPFAPPAAAGGVRGPTTGPATQPARRPAAVGMAAAR